MRVLLIGIFLWIGAGAASAQVLTEVVFVGLERTNPAYLRPFIGSEVGAPYDANQVAVDVQTLRNMSAIAWAEAETEIVPEGLILRFQVQEFKTLLPTINFGGITDNFWFQLGGVDLNWRGRGFQIGGHYRYYDRHSFRFFHDLPYWHGSWGLSYELNRTATEEPAMIAGESVYFNVDRLVVMANGRYDWWSTTRAGATRTLTFGGGYLRETYATADENSGFETVDFNKYVLQMGLRQQRLNYFYHQLSGYANDLSLQTVKTGRGPFDFWKVLNVFRGYTRLTPRINWAMRLRAGLSANDNALFAPFVLDSYLNVRGSGNRVARGSSELTLNLEHRHTIWQREKFAAQLIGFVDLSAWRPPGQALRDMFDQDNVVTFAGAGVRVHVLQLYNLTFRVDYGRNLLDTNQHGFVIGLGQYF